MGEMGKRIVGFWVPVWIDIPSSVLRVWQYSPQMELRET